MRLPLRSIFLSLLVLAVTVGCNEPRKERSTPAPTTEAPKPIVAPTEPAKLPPPTEPAPRPVLKLPEVRLPVAAFARAAEKPAGEFAISLTPDGLTLGDQAVKSTPELKRLLAARIEADGALRAQAPVVRVDRDIAQGKVIGLLRLCQTLGFREATLRVLRQSGADAAEGEIPVNLENYGFVSYGRRANPAKPRATPDEEPVIDGVLIDVKGQGSDGGVLGEIETMRVQDARGGSFACSTLEKLRKYLDILKEDVLKDDGSLAKETVRIASDPKLKYGRFLEVLEPCQKVGFGRIVLHEPKAGDPADVFE